MEDFKLFDLGRVTFFGLGAFAPTVAAVAAAAAAAAALAAAAAAAAAVAALRFANDPLQLAFARVAAKFRMHKA